MSYMFLMRFRSSPIFLFTIFLFSCGADDQYNTWEQYKGGNESIHYSSLSQIDTTNVKSLQLVWEYRTGDVDTVNHSQIQCNPIIVDGILYGTSARLKLFAIDAAAGKEKWQFNPFDSLNKEKLNNCRGVTFWSDGQNDKRIFYTAGPNLYCVNAATGKLISSFGNNGKIDLHDGLDRDVRKLYVSSTSPGIIYGNLLIMGSRVYESAASAPGHIRAYDVRTGKRVWIFHTIPHPGEEGYETWDDPEAYKNIGGANAWSGFSLDMKRGILFAVTGSAADDWYGGKRTGNNLFANCLLALDAASGKRLWHFQAIHHDVWDRDLPSPPALVTIRHKGRDVEAVALTTKTGFIFMFERGTGKPIHDIVERPVPSLSDLVGEKLSPTQPYPVSPAPFMRQLFTVNDINPLLPDSSYREVKSRLMSYKNDHMFNPSSLQGTVEFPGLDGGAEWGGPTYDPATGILYVNANEMAWVIRSAEIKRKAGVIENYEQAGQRLYEANCMSCHGADRKGAGNFPSIVQAKTKYTISGFDTLLQSGRRMMPAFMQLNDTERKAIATVVLGIENQRKKRFTDTSKTNDPFTLPYSSTGNGKFLSKEGYPAIAPPWGTLSAIDLNTGLYVWKKPLGNDTAFPASKQPTGTENYGASVVTAGGLLFIAATKDGKFRAFNKTNGALLWEVDLPVPAFATPSIYEVNEKQFVVIACGGGKLGTKSGDHYLAFALPGE